MQRSKTVSLLDYLVGELLQIERHLEARPRRANADYRGLHQVPRSKMMRNLIALSLLVNFIVLEHTRAAAYKPGPVMKILARP